MTSEVASSQANLSSGKSWVQSKETDRMETTLQRHFGCGALLQRIKARKWPLVGADSSPGWGFRESRWGVLGGDRALQVRPAGDLSAVCFMITDLLFQGRVNFFMPKTSAIPSPSLLTQPQILAVWFHSVMPWVLWQGPRQCAFKVFLPPGHYYICHPFNSLSPFSLNTVKKGAYRLFQTNAFNPGTSLLELSANCGIQTVPPNYLKSFRVALGEHWRFNFVGWFVVLVFSNLHLSH